MISPVDQKLRILEIKRLRDKEKLSFKQIAIIVGISDSRVNMLYFGTKSGREHTRSLVRQRDNYTCQQCGFQRTEQQVRKHNDSIDGLVGKIKNLDVHHRDGLCGKLTLKYDRKNSIDGLITLCHKCHYNQTEHRCKSKEFAEQSAKRFN